MKENPEIRSFVSKLLTSFLLHRVFFPTSCFQLTVLKPWCKSLGSSSARACLALSRAGRMTSFHRVVWRPTISWMLLNSLLGSTSVSRLPSCRSSRQHRNSCSAGEKKKKRSVRLKVSKVIGFFDPACGSPSATERLLQEPAPLRRNSGACRHRRHVVALTSVMTRSFFM